MFLNGNCLESLKKEEPEGGRRRLSHPGNMGWMRPSQEITPLNRSHYSGFGLFCGDPGPEIGPFSLQAFSLAVSLQEMVLEIHRVFMDHEYPCPRLTSHCTRVAARWTTSQSYAAWRGCRRAWCSMWWKSPAQCTRPEVTSATSETAQEPGSS
ncbi:putative protein CLUHP3 [Macaca nemestrina]|uniref:putative protein CLUHP3 n=1 Tax=Macaca nemestrina TaxID=9545 RepID=UPI0039B8E203